MAIKNKPLGKKTAWLDEIQTLYRMKAGTRAPTLSPYLIYLKCKIIDGDELE